MAIKISGNTIIDDSRNITNAKLATVENLTFTVAENSGVIDKVAHLNASNQDLEIKVNNVTGVLAAFSDGVGSFGRLLYGGATKIDATSTGAEIYGDLFVNNINLNVIEGGALNGVVSLDTTSTNTIENLIDVYLDDTGGGITYSSGTIAHADTSSQASVNNSGTTVIQDITLDGYGHITSIGSTTIEAGGLGTANTGVPVGSTTNIYPGGTPPYSQDFFKMTLNQDTTVDLRDNSITQHNGKVYTFSLAVVQSTANNGPHTVTWDSAIKWPDGLAPSISVGNGEEDLFTFVTIDGGASYYGFVSGQNLS